MKLWKCAWWVACAATFASAVDAAEGKKYALVMGVENYDHPKLREPAPLKYSVDDVAELADRLRKHGFTAAVLTDDTGRRDAKSEPTKANFDRLLAQLMERCKPEDAVLLAFAGHGLQFSGQADAYFCPKDARPFADQTKTLISLSQVYASLDKSFAGTKMILVDACRNDPDPGRGRGLDADSAPPPPKGVAALFSCSAGQRAFEHDSLKHGVFFHHVLKGLSGDAASRKGEITFSGLAEYVSQAVPETVGELFSDRSDIQQLPNLKADFVGRSPLLVQLEAGPAAAPPIASQAANVSGGSEDVRSAKPGRKSSGSIGRSPSSGFGKGPQIGAKSINRLLNGTWEEVPTPGNPGDTVNFSGSTFSYRDRVEMRGRYVIKGDKVIVMTFVRNNPPNVVEWQFEIDGDVLTVHEGDVLRTFKRE